jgi:peptide ABC transporter peptide-binding protein
MRTLCGRRNIWRNEMKKKNWLYVTTAATVLALAACSSKKETTATKTPLGTQTKFATEAVNDAEAIKGGTLKYALVASSGFKGVFIDELAQDSLDSTISSQIDASIFEFDENRQLTNTGLASIDFDVEGKSVTVTLNSKDYKWSDGQPVTIDDYIFTYQSIGHKDYTGSRYNSKYENVEGMKEFHEGKADSVSGLEKIDDYSVKIHFKEMRPSMKLAGGALSAYIMPKHIFSTIPVAEWDKSEYVRGTKFVGLGAFKLESIIPGESVTLVPNEHYYKGRAKLDKVVMEIVSPDNIVSEMKAGKYDIAEMPNAQYESYKDLTNVNLVSTFKSSFEYVAFHLGKFDKASGKNITDSNAKMSDPVLRQAIAYALDMDTVGETLYHGLQRGTNSIIIPFFKDVYNAEQEGFKYNPEKAKQMLEEAGYKDVDGDGIRENKDGSPLSITFAARTRDDANESLIQQYLLWWKEIGLDVQLYTGRTIESNNFYEKVQTDDPEIDMFAAGWGTGFDPNPSNLFGETAKFNFARFVSEKGNSIMNNISSTEAFDDAKNVEFYKEWQQYVHDEAFIFPTLVGDLVTAVNKRVKYYDTRIGTSNSKSALYQLEVVSDTQVK